jgi:hypothetical protein
MTEKERAQVAERIRSGEFGDRWRLSLLEAERRSTLSVEELELEYMKRSQRQPCPHCGRV